MDFKKSRTITLILALVGLALVIGDFVLYHGQMRALFYVGWILLLGAYIIDHKYKRCPHCHSYLKESPNENSYCPNCGKKIFE